MDAKENFVRLEVLYPCQVGRRCVEQLRDYSQRLLQLAQSQAPVGGAVSARTELWVRRQAHFKQTMILLGTHPKYPTLVSAD